MKNDILQLLNSVQFTEKEKEACMPLIHKLLGFSIEAWSRGLLALEYEIEKETDECLKKGLQMIVDAVWREEVENTLSDIIDERAKQDVVTGSERTMVVNLLSGYITMRGILLIQDGEPTRKLASELLSFLEGKSAPDPDNSDLPDDLRLDNIAAEDVNDFSSDMADDIDDIDNEVYTKDSFRATCSNCKKRNEVSVLWYAKGLNDWYDFHCAHCGLKIHEIPAAKMPKSKIVENET